MWYFLSFRSNRQHAGNLGYNDDPERTYRYDSFVANHLKVAEGDLVAVVGRRGLFGFGRIDRILKHPGSKELRRCPISGCGTTAIKERSRLKPKYRCHNKHVFEEPIVDTVECIQYEARLGNFLRRENAVPLDVLRRACPRYSDQLAIQQLDLIRLLPYTKEFQSDLMGLVVSANVRYVEPAEADEKDAAQAAYTPTGTDSRPSIMRQIKYRRGQRNFRNKLIRRYKPRCQVTGCTILDVIEAAHISPYRGENDHHPDNGLLLRADLHTLFDLDLIGVDPESLSLHLNPLLAGSEYEMFRNSKLNCNGHPPSAGALRKRWNSFCSRIQRRESAVDCSQTLGFVFSGADPAVHMRDRVNTGVEMKGCSDQTQVRLSTMPAE
jgi:hypothetical protein